ncbi:hypothetical protein LTR10_022005 [Elasticomyces elasticus]|uniref:Major facilitator superfamily (MFS) profile domain-containing protein n=1 Tax=Exophiala sideris TaxID=1016849 RepID=A0ABR0IYW3_9EURO|nr:hypothetical protein LTR10_022005 [Elasticomyces elasticus]KAK5022914.1 hypothetical protein LTS07_009642 [Exophiala sideris]KAK5026407.1 hypothetical protein LTR13_010021 [Exophiala sideris]KAK5052342.1 hypothetical protein LTR69_009878 [Exophiala sideris]KAK5177369.1 hypothetical protein LTR44_010164 [Eurotiomycetes sp. CCFEE 6388]
MPKDDEAWATPPSSPTIQLDEPLTHTPRRHNSNANSKGKTSASQDGNSGQPKPSETIGRTIQELERLLAEAVKLAEEAGALSEDVEEQQSSLETPMAPTRRASEGSAKRMNRHLEAVSNEATNIPASTRAANPLRRTESAIGPTDVDSPVDTSPLEGSIRLLPPDSNSEPPGERKGALSKHQGMSEEVSPARKKRSVTILEPPESARRDSPTNVPRGKRKHNQSLERPIPQPTTRRVPALQLNDVDLKDADAEDKDGELGRPGMLEVPRTGHERHFSQMFGINSRQGSMNLAHADEDGLCKIDLTGARHIDVDHNADDLDVHKTCHHAPVARNWPDSRKRFTAFVSCINTACLGLILGIYAGEVPAIQYVVVDLNRRIIYGNAFLYCGLIFPTLGIMVISYRSPDVARYRVILLLARGLSGLAFGFANMSNLGTLLDVFGASLSSSKSHENLASPSDVRRHGGGMGVWLAAWSWCSTGSIGIGFVIGAFIIDGSSVD